MSRLIVILNVLLVCCWVLPASGQQADSVRSRVGRGGQVVLTNSGFGLGGFLSRGLGPLSTLQAEASLGAVKDEREVAFFDRFGRRDVPNKANYLLEMPIQVGLERRIFASRIEANFRPFISVSGGPVLGWLYPYFDDENDNGAYDEGEPTEDVISGLPGGSLRTGLTVSASFGARFGTLNRPGYGVRFGYRITHYARDIALLESSIKAPVRRFVSPVVTVYFGMLYQ